MPPDPALAALLRADLADTPDVVEKPMFGGLCFMVGRHMLCGCHRDRGMFRVGKDRHARAVAVPGVGPMAMNARPMSGMVEAGPEAMADPATRAALPDLARAFVAGLPPR